MRKVYFLLLIATTMLLFSIKANAQTGIYSTAGTGQYQDDIIWLTWDYTEVLNGDGSVNWEASGLQNGNGSGTYDAVSNTYGGFITNGIPYLYNLPGGGILTATFSNIDFRPWNNAAGNGTGNTNKTRGYHTGDMMTVVGDGNSGDVWAGGGLQYGYFIPGKEIIYSNKGPGPANEPGEDGQEIAFDVTFELTVDGVNIPVHVIFSDCETTNPNVSASYDEEIHAITDGDPWQLIETVNSANYIVAGVGTIEAEILDTEQSGTPRGVPLLLTKGTGTTTTISYEFLYKGNGSTHNGHQGIVLGVIYPKDHGDAPMSYGDASHYQTFGSTGTTANPSMGNLEPLYLGTRADTEDAAQFSGDAMGDGADEDGITLPATIVQGTNTLDVVRTGTGFLNGWIDFNIDGDFEDAGEHIIVEDDGTPFAPLTFTAPQMNINGATFARFRICPTAGSCNTPTGITVNGGEVEDYMVQIILPIELVYFTAELNASGDVDIAWQTLTEENNDYFDVERSNNGLEWEIIDTQLGAGNSQTSINYTSVDENALPGVNYYRLKQTDYDGTSTYSDVVAVSVENSNKLFISPNVVTPGESVEVTNLIGKINYALLIDGAGRVLKNLGPVRDNARETLELPVLASGVYYIKFDGDKISHTEKIVVR